jgi:ABC-type nickel/cobalt efflux system permease component RcnA
MNSIEGRKRNWKYQVCRGSIMTAVKIIITTLLVLIVGHWLLWRYLRRRIAEAKRLEEMESSSDDIDR